MPMASKKISVRNRVLSGLAGAIALAAASQGHAMTVVATFDPSITNDPNAAQIEASINQALGFYSHFSNPITVSIYFKTDPNLPDLGTSRPTLSRYTYSDYVDLITAASAANPSNTVLATAVANLPYGNTPATTGLPFVRTTSASGRALGDPTDVGAYGADGIFGHGSFDGIVTLDGYPGDLSYGHVGPNQYSGITTIFHEVDEILGVGGAGSSLGRSAPAMGQEDLYRYDWFTGLPSYTTDPNAISYFSIDGGYHYWQFFNQDPNGDYADWAGYSYCDPEFVQDSFGCPGNQAVFLNLNAPEVVALQAIGYNLAVPEPATWAMLLLGFGVIGAGLRRGRRAIAA
jgi:hypothetical protein